MTAPLFLTLRLETYLHSLNLQVAVLIILCFREALAKLVFVHYPYQLQYVFQPESYKKVSSVSKLFSLTQQTQGRNFTVEVLVLLCKEPSKAMSCFQSRTVIETHRK